MEFERLNLLTGEVASTASAMQPSDIPAIVESAQAGFQAWSAMGPNARRAVLTAAAALESKQAEFVDGKSVRHVPDNAPDYGQALIGWFDQYMLVKR